MEKIFFQQTVTALKNSSEWDKPLGLIRPTTVPFFSSHQDSQQLRLHTLSEEQVFGRRLAIVDPSQSKPTLPIKKAKPEVPAMFATDYNKAWQILNICPNAAAGSARRALHLLLRKFPLDVHEEKLHLEIDNVLNGSTFKPLLAPMLNFVREAGNLGLHPSLNPETDELIEVSHEQARLCLEVLEFLFDLFIVLPERTASQIKDFNRTLQSIGRSPIKTYPDFSIVDSLPLKIESTPL